MTTTTTETKKTREDFEKLKADWLKDPNWNIENTEGFEEFTVELTGFREHHEEEWKIASEQRRQKELMTAPAFPLIETNYLYGGEPNGFESSGGLTKREMFAAMAMLGMISEGCDVPEVTARLAVGMADALIAELNR